MKNAGKLALCGSAAGALNGFLGASGGMVLLPLLKKTGLFSEEELFSSCLKIMVPICLVSLLASGRSLPLKASLPYLLGSFLGGLIGLKLRVSPLILHRALGILITVGGIRLLW